ncbi:MAG: RNA methyltransferase [Phycisphaerae bacterium]|jgi:tRNA G18 (ribose-2'-O)-methylase SpoU|nr:RNA methyltransferase [Phycisphaerae bacterium]MDP7286784.1 RNA methyltransferase [Phycisphaerae bacterium]
MHVNQDDPRLEAFANLRDRDLRGEGRLIAEGRWLAHRLISQGYPNTRVLTSERFADEFAQFVASGDLLVADDETMSAVAGFDFHRGVIASSDRPALPTLAEALEQSETGGTVVVLPDTGNAENLGSIFRTTAGLGVEVILLGEQCCDEFSRRVLRVSMGAAFELKLTRSTRLEDDLAMLNQRGYKLAAMVLDESADDLADFRADGPTALMFGSEADGLAQSLIDRADVRLTIPMSKQVDSLNLAASAAIALWRIQTA